jgi:hypothetical protein
MALTVAYQWPDAPETLKEKSHMQESSSPTVGKPAAWSRFRPLKDMAFRRIGWWWLLLSLLPVVVVVLAAVTGLEWFYGKDLQESVAVPLAGLVAFSWALRARLERNVFFGLLAAQGFVFTMREIHFQGTGDGVYIATAIIWLIGLRLAWRVDWEQASAKINWRTITALGVSAATYAVAILIQRRVFKGLPGEARLHVPLEEVSENFAHLFFLVSSFVGRKRAKTEPTV